MDNPYAIHIRCDGSMDYDSKQTGGYGFVIEFPDFVDHPPVEKFTKADGQGIHRLEMMAVLAGMNELLRFRATNGNLLRDVSGVTVHSDRLSISDDEMNNPYRIQEYRKRKWKTHEGNPVKHSDLLDAIDKTRKKLSAVFSGRIEIRYTREKKNKVADKLSRVGKRDGLESKTARRGMRPKVGKRKLTGAEIKYNLMSVGDILDVHIYYKNPVQDKYELHAEIMDGRYTGRTLRIFLTVSQEMNLHRWHFYRMEITEVTTYAVRMACLEEIIGTY
jgi:ribonuclease HI